ncbi:hypothetical protein CFB40_19305 [Burkholderia sp. AU31652]|uniref:Lipoprotein n=1 Tax=Burkholderia contaminans TaxID=488447 RepID=A0A6P3A661_9BURK|nr:MULTISPECIES: hypothetical protein [Burkholderia]OXI83260.1 hypothetical protein CFB40_19305 [Burkholderia sp. AU31652]OXJ10831.1 hypothetical protein CFB45_28505 [Burkholderia sp. HI2500]VWD42110.1 hypothetical protein BCO71171_04727 [Burkholderia contaminans]
MRFITAALLSVAALVPSLAPAQTPLPDPADATVAVPDITVTSVFDGYRPYRDDEGPGWKQLNRDVMERPAKGRATGGAAGSGAAHSKHGGSAQ